MIYKSLRIIAVLVGLFAAACGTVATPIWEAPEASPTLVGQVVIAPTRVPPTQVQPTQVPPTVLPSSTPTTESPTDTPVPPTPTSGPRDGITVLISLSNPTRGQELFNTFYDEVSFACGTCHRVDSEEQLIGPGLLNIGVRAGTEGHRDAENQAPERYIYNSIVDPLAFTVPGFEAQAALMPQIYGQLFKEQDIYDIIAYLMTLKS